MLQLGCISVQLVSSILICFKSTINFSTLHLEYTLAGKKKPLSFIITFYIIIIITLYDILLAKATPGKKPLKKVDQRIFGGYI